MSTNTPAQPSKEAPIPLLPDLKVIRDSYCNQTITDKVIRSLQKKRPDLIADIAFEINKPSNYRVGGRLANPLYQRRAQAICDYLKDESSKEIESPATNLGLIDLIFELSRRIAKVYDLPDLDFFGTSIAEGPDHPLLPLAPPSNHPDSEGVTSELRDRIVALIYERAPRLFYELAEERIRQLRLKCVLKDLHKALENLAPEGAPTTTTARTPIIREINSRLHKMCGCPDIK